MTIIEHQCCAFTKIFIDLNYLKKKIYQALIKKYIIRVSKFNKLNKSI